MKNWHKLKHGHYEKIVDSVRYQLVWRGPNYGWSVIMGDRIIGAGEAKRSPGDKVPLSPPWEWAQGCIDGFEEFTRDDGVECVRWSDGTVMELQ